MTNLSRPVRRLLAATILVLALLGAWSLLVGPIAARVSANAQSIAQSRELLERYRRIAGTRDRLARQLERARRDRATGDHYFNGPSPELVAAQLQNKVKAIVQARGGRLKSTQIMRHQDEGEWRRIIVRVTMVADKTAIMAEIIHALEAADPYLFLDNVLVRTPNANRRRAPAAGKRVAARATPRGGSSGELQVRYDVHGYMRADKS